MAPLISAVAKLDEDTVEGLLREFAPGGSGGTVRQRTVTRRCVADEADDLDDPGALAAPPTEADGCQAAPDSVSSREANPPGEAGGVAVVVP